MTHNFQTTESADVGDYLKVAACTAVIMQSVLGQAITAPLNGSTQWVIGLLYGFVKFTAPAFIFGILYTTISTTKFKQPPRYRHYLRQQSSALLIPTLFWTSVYLFVFPNQQQERPFHNLMTLLWQFVNGNAAPHLWYNTMMGQFIILMPLFWWVARYCHESVTHTRWVLLLTTFGYLGWVYFYDAQVWHGPEQHAWYLLDRVWLSFLLYAVLGTLAAINAHRFAHGLQSWRWWLLAGWALTFAWTSGQLFTNGLPVKLNNAPYIQLSMVLYDLATIALIAWYATRQISRNAPSLPWIHWLATYAYRAYLANVCWLQLIWLLTGRWLLQAPILVIITTYVGSWLLSFASAYVLHQLVHI